MNFFWLDYFVVDQQNFLLSSFHRTDKLMELTLDLFNDTISVLFHHTEMVVL